MLARACAVTAYLVGIAGAGVFFLWVLATGTGFVSRTDDAAMGMCPWFGNGGLLLLFALQHSGMARRSFKNVLTRWAPTHLERSVYVASAGLTTIALTLCWQPLPGSLLWHGPIWIVGISLIAAFGLVGCCATVNHAAYFGLTQAWTGNVNTRWPLQMNGPYRYVRHPLMVGVLIAIWAQPIMPPELCMMNVGMTVYILIALRLEERDLLREFGEEYEKYQRKVPALIPFVKRWLYRPGE